MSEPLTLPPCRVCGGTATGIHYGVNTCEACKAFFRRSLVENNKYVCPRDGDCKIINHKRANCSACRLKKCLELGMSKKAVRHGRYTVAIRTKTILEVKQLEREQALKDKFAMADSFSKPKMPEIISVPEVAKSPDSSVMDTQLSSVAKTPISSSSTWESSQLSSNDSLQSTVIESSQMSSSDIVQSSIEQCAIASNFFSMEPTSFFSSDDIIPGNDLDIFNTMNLDIHFGNDLNELSGPDMFLNTENSEAIEIDLSSEKIDFLEIGSNDLLDLSQVIDVLQVGEADIPNTNFSSPQNVEQSNTAYIQQASPDTTMVDESLSQYGSQATGLQSIKLFPDSYDIAQMVPKDIPTTFDFSNSGETSMPASTVSTAPPKKKIRASFNLNEDMETLQLINTLVSAQEILYPSMRKYFNKEFAEVIHREFWEKTQLQTELFGSLKSLSNAEYNSFFLATGIDVDGRMDMLTKAAEGMQKEIVKYISFVKSIPGWEDVNNSDKLTLIKASRFEYWLLGKFVHINPELGVTASECCGFTHKQILQMWGSPQNITSVNNFAAKLKKLDLTYEEIALLRGVVVLSRDRCVLREPEVVENMQWKILQSFIHLIKKTHPHEPLRFARCMDKITQLRELTDLNYKANKNLENFQKSLIQNYPLLYECVTYEG